MKSHQEQIIVRNIFTLTKKTVNVEQLAEQLTQAQVFTQEECQSILSSDNNSKCNLLYEIFLRKPPSCFQLLITGLRQSGNANMANLLEQTPPQHKAKLQRRISQLTKRVSCSDFYEDVVGNKPVSGREMGIAEILEENASIKKNLELFSNLLNLNNSSALYDIFPQFVVKVTLMLRDWVAIYKRRATLGKLVEVLRSAKYFNCAARIWKMFERSDLFDERWELDDERRSPVSITGQESKISQILDNNPSFCLHVERLFLMLNLPMELYKVYTTQPNFMKNSNLILKVWKDMNEKNGTVQRLASIFAQNGHPHTAENLRRLI